MRPLEVLIALTIFLQSFGSGYDEYSPKQDNIDRKMEFLTELSNNLKSDLKELEGPYKSDLKTVYKNRSEAIKNRVENDHFYFNTEWSEYIDRITNAIIDANPDYDYERVRVLISKYHWPNAFSFGEGTIGINLGLIRHLENEDQLAFVICHEIAHYILDHNNKAVLQRLKSADSEEYKARLDEIKRSEYYRASKLKELMRENLYSERRHSRIHEYSADSLGLVLYLNTNYDPAQSITTLELLDKLNDYVNPQSLNLYEILKIQKAPKPQSGGFIVQTIKEDIEKDSVVTHPDCELRIEALHRYSNRLKSTTRSNNSTQFDQFKKEVNFELLESYMHFNNYDLALTYSLRMQTNYPNSLYLKNVTSLCLYTLTWARKEHKASDFASRFIEYGDTTASSLQDIIFENRYRELLKSSYDYTLDLYQNDIKSDTILYTLYWYSVQFNLDNQAEELKEEYLLHFQNGAFTHLLLDN